MEVNRLIIMKLSLKIIAIFSIAILSTFIADNLHEFFGDWLCEGARVGKFIPETGANLSHYELIGCDYGGRHNPTWHYGYRHWIYIVMCVVLFCFNLGKSIEESISPN